MPSRVCKPDAAEPRDETPQRRAGESIGAGRSANLHDLTDLGRAPPERVRARRCADPPAPRAGIHAPACAGTGAAHLRPVPRPTHAGRRKALRAAGLHVAFLDTCGDLAVICAPFQWSTFTVRGRMRHDEGAVGDEACRGEWGEPEAVRRLP